MPSLYFQMIEKFGSRERQSSMKSGFHVSFANNNVVLWQISYISKLRTIPEGASFDEYRHIRAKLARAAHNRPKSYFAVSLVAQGT